MLESARLSDRRLSTKLVPTLADRGCRVVSATIPPQSLISVSSTGAAISLKQLLNYHHEAEWTLFQTHYFSEKIWQRWESNPDLWICSQELWPLDHRGGLLTRLKPLGQFGSKRASSTQLPKFSGTRISRQTAFVLRTPQHGHVT
jgi:hypothetical protein